MSCIRHMLPPVVAMVLLLVQALPLAAVAAELPPRSKETLVPYRDEQGRILGRKPEAEAPAAPATPSPPPAAPGSSPAALQNTAPKAASPAVPPAAPSATPKAAPAAAAQAAPPAAAPAKELPPRSAVCTASRQEPGRVTLGTAQNRPAGPGTFGMIFAQGLVPETVGAAGLATQVDIKRRWPDGSVKHAIVTAEVPSLAANASRDVVLTPAAPRGAGASVASRQLAETLPPVEVVFAIHGGPTVTSTLARALRAASGEPWLNGPLVVEYLVKDTPTDAAGKADPDLEVHYHVRHYPAAGTTRVAVIGENVKWTSPGNIPYDLRVQIDGKPAYAKQNAGEWPNEKAYLGHPFGSRWVKRFWIGRPLDDLQVGQDVACLVATGLLPRYDPTVRVKEATLAGMDQSWRGKAATDILQNGIITPYFPQTGRRQEVGPLPTWTAIYLLSQDPRAQTVTMGTGDLSGGVPIHFRDPKTGRPVSIDDYPGFSLNERGTTMPLPTRERSSTPWVMKRASAFTPDVAHQASFAYVPYLFTGDYYYFEEMAFWANFNLIEQNKGFRQEALGLLSVNQTRGVAWSMRNLAHAAALSPDNTPERRYFEKKLENNIEHFNKKLEDKNRHPLGVTDCGDAYTRGWKNMKDEYCTMPPWEHNFLIWSFSHIVDQGYSAAIPFRDSLMGFTLGLVGNPQQITPHAASAYFLIVGKRGEDRKFRWAETWKEVDYLSFDAPGDEVRTRPKATEGDYARILRGALICAADANRPGAKEALRWVDEQQQPKLDEFSQSDPTWALRLAKKN